MINLHKILLTGTVISSLFLTSCNSDDDDNPGLEEVGEFANGFFVLNEGNFGSANASVSFISANGELQNTIFQTINGTSLGDTAQSILLEDDIAYIVLNGSNTIEVVNRYTFESLGTISEGLSNPRYMVIENGKGFVSNWGDGSNVEDDYIAVINLSNLSVESTISVPEGPERLEEENGKIYVAHQGGYGLGSTVSVINASSNSITSTIQVGDVPNSLFEEDGKLYVLCGGKPSWSGEETNGVLYVINSSNDTVTSSYEFSTGLHPSQLFTEDDMMYYTVDNAIYSTNLNFTTLPSNSVFTTAEQGVYGIYGFAVEEGKIYVGDAGDYLSNGKVYVYSTSGVLQEEYEVGPLPNGFYFND